MKKILGTMLAVSIATWGVGCGSDDEEPSSSVAEETGQLLAPVVEGLSKPTGKVSKETVPVVIGDSRKSSSASSAASMVPGGGGQVSPQQARANPNACMTTGPSGGTIDYDCMTEGEMTGFVTYQMEQKGNIYMLMTFDDVCKDGTCVNGKWGMEMSGDASSGNYTMTAAGDLSISSPDEETATFKFGYRMSQQGGTTTMENVYVNPEGESYVLKFESLGDSGSITVKGANGEYSCTWEGETGSCTDGTETFGWGEAP